MELPPPLSRSASRALEPSGHDDAICPKQPIPTLLLVLVTALVVEGVAFAGSRLWYSPDAVQYITLGVAIRERLDFSHELFAIRPPGYPLILAAVFRLFGTDSATALMALQHGMVVCTAVVGASIAWMLRPSRAFALTAGVLGAFSLHLSGYANAALAEVPYTLLVTVCVHLLIRYQLAGTRRSLVYASVAAGGAALVKPIGELMLVTCAAVALHRAWYGPRGVRPGSAGGRLKSIGFASVLAVVPGAVLVAPAIVRNLHYQGDLRLTSMGALALYQRAVVVDKLESPQDGTMAVVRAAYAQAGDKGLIDSAIPHNTAAGTWQAHQACRLVYGLSYGEAADLLGKAGAEMLYKHPWRALRRSIGHAGRMLMRPSSGYRLQPSRSRDSGMFRDLAAQRVGATELDRYLPLQSLDTLSRTPLARSARWLMDQVIWRYHQRLELGPSFSGLFDTPYEEYALLFLLGCVISLSQPSRRLWLLLGSVVVGHIVVSATWLGPIPRYKIPVHP
ncbi:MAG: ArnT family glycosyltransferase, partial [Phycisphaerae bacterium]